jgi:hypothetical protein
MPEKPRKKAGAVAPQHPPQSFAMKSKEVWLTRKTAVRGGLAAPKVGDKKRWVYSPQC